MMSTKITYKDYLLLEDNSRRYELINGGLYLLPSPIPYHQKVILNIEDILRNFVKRDNLGEVFVAPCDVYLTDIDVIQPDIFFIKKDRLNIIKKKNIKGAPDLIIEVISKKREKIDRIIKKKLYAQHKVKEYWLVDIEKKTVEVFILKNKIFKKIDKYRKGHSFKSRILQGLTVELNEIF